MTGSPQTALLPPAGLAAIVAGMVSVSVTLDDFQSVVGGGSPRLGLGCLAFPGAGGRTFRVWEDNGRVRRVEIDLAADELVIGELAAALGKPRAAAAPPPAARGLRAVEWQPVNSVVVTAGVAKDGTVWWVHVVPEDAAARPKISLSQVFNRVAEYQKVR